MRSALPSACAWLASAILACSPPALRLHAESAAPSFASTAKGNIFTDTNGAVTLPIPAGSTGGSVAIRDESDHLISTVAVPAQPDGSGEISVPLPRKGYYALTAQVTLADGSAHAASTTAAVVGPVPDDTARLQSRLGLWTVQGDPALALAAGARWNRRMTTIKDLPENLLDPDHAASVTVKPFSPADSFTEVGVFSFGLPLWLMDSPPAKKGFGNPFVRPKDWSTLKALVAAYVRKQGDNFPPYLEVYNEPEWQWKGTNEDLVKCLAAIADGIKEVRPDVQVLGPGFSSIRIKDPARLDLVTADKLGLFDHLDGLVVHAYVDGTEPEGEFIQRVIDLKNYLREIGRPGFPVHLTEFGWTSAAGTWQKPVDELTQARYVTRSLTLLAALGIENATYFCLQFKAAPNPGERGFSLLHPDSTPKPAYAAYANVARWLADVRGLGTWLHLTPTTNLILFEKPHGTSVAVAWDTAGPRMIDLPLETTLREDMTGRPLADSAQLNLSPSPVFFAFAKDRTPSVKMLPKIEVMRGGDPVSLPPGGAWIAPSPLAVKDRILTVPPETANGDYLLLSHDGETWLGQPVVVIPPIEVAPPVLNWPAGRPAPDLSVRLTSHALAAAGARLSVSLKGIRSQFLDTDPVKPGETRTLALPLQNLTPGVRYKGTLTVDSRHAGRRDQIARPLDLTILASEHAANGSGPDWERITPVDFSRWDQFGGPISADDCSAALQSAYDDRGLHLRIVVRDDEHLQTRSPEDMWSQDAIQVGLDPDIQKTWEPNDLFGLKGHRVFEYGLGWNGDPAAQPMTWRWSSYLPDLPVGVSEPRIQLHVTRAGDKTTYDACFPWAVLGLDKAPAPGSAIGLALAVTDADTGKKGRRILRLFGGITDGKDPEKYGPLWLR